MSQEANHIDAAIADLEAWRDRINASIETLKHLRAQGSAPPSTPPPGNARHAQGSEITHDAFFQMTIPDAAKKYLALVKQTKPNPDVAEALIKGGLKTAAKNFPETLRSILSRDDRFVRVNSEWGLAEWYPAMRRERKPRSSNGNDEEEQTKETIEQAETTSVKPAGSPSKGGAVKARTLHLVDERPSDIFSAEAIAQALGAKVPTVRSCLSELMAEGLISKPSQGRYQSKKGHPAHAA